MTDPTEPTQPASPPPAAPVAPAAPPASAAPWAPPGAAPFGVPAASVAPATRGPVPGSGYAAPVGYAPPSGYAPPPGYGGVTAAPAAASAYPPSLGGFATARRSKALGFVALILALVATIGAGVLAALASFNIGLGAGREIANRAFDAEFDWSILTPVRDWVLLGEVAFWAGTIVGITALVLGIVAIVTRRGRGPGIAAVVVAALGPVVFGIVVQGLITAGLASGSGIGG